MIRPDWDEYFMQLVQVVKARATCPKLSVGTVIVDPTTHDVVQVGYNGTPRQVAHCTDNHTGRCIEINGHCVLSSHSERNAIYTAARRGVATDRTVLYTSYRPCLECSKAIIQAGVVEVIFRARYVGNSPEYLRELALADDIFRQAGVQMRVLGLPE